MSTCHSSVFDTGLIDAPSVRIVAAANKATYLNIGGHFGARDTCRTRLCPGCPAIWRWPFTRRVRQQAVNFSNLEKKFVRSVDFLCPVVVCLLFSIDNLPHFLRRKILVLNFSTTSSCWSRAIGLVARDSNQHFLAAAQRNLLMAMEGGRSQAARTADD